MSQQLISHSPDLKKLRDEGYEVCIVGSHLTMSNIPYVNSKREIAFGVLVSELTLAGNVTSTPNTHVVSFIGDYPCDKKGNQIRKIEHTNGKKHLDENLEVDRSFSSKPINGNYKDYYEKMTTYAAIISSHAQAIDPSTSPRTYKVIEDIGSESVFNYVDTASSRAEILAATRKLEQHKIAIIGLGGTGSYLLDYVAKTPVAEIHLFDGDVLLQHNAFRAPGAPSLNVLETKPPKVEYFSKIYSNMHRGIFAHYFYIDDSNVCLLKDMDFIFICIDGGTEKSLIVDRLFDYDKPFIDVGMGLYLNDDDMVVGGQLRVTSCIDGRRHVAKKFIPKSKGHDHGLYGQNIQVADLNALNAALAVFKWKKYCKFYQDLDDEINMIYIIDGNMINNQGSKGE